MAGPDPSVTPMMAQYRQIKSELPKDALLLFRLGDFYELFFEDAQAAAGLLNVALTQRNGIPMCGIPYHATHAYVGRLLKAGRKVAICDQIEEPKPGKLVQRAVSQILSPGTHFDERLLSADRNNFLAAITRHSTRFGLAVVDFTTGEFRVTELEDERTLGTELERLRPAEIIVPMGDDALMSCLGVDPEAKGSEVRPHGGGRGVITPYEDWAFGPETAPFTLREHFKVETLDGFGLRGKTAGIGAAGGILHYLGHQLRRDVTHLTRLRCYEVSNFMVLDAVTLRTLEVVEPMRADAGREVTLLAAMNRTVTPMGARRLRDWLTQPLAHVASITERQQAVQAWIEAGSSLDAFRQALREVRDLERTLGRLASGTGNARDLVSLRNALRQIPATREAVAHVAAQGASALLDTLAQGLQPLPSLLELLNRSLMDDAPMALKEGGMFQDGFNAELDELRALASGGKEWMARLQQEESTRTGIPSLKVGFNSVFGYFLEVTKAHLSKVPPEYIRKQTVANAERFITPELKTMEQRILGAQERAERLEYDLFLHVRQEALAHLPACQAMADAAAQLDVLTSFAEVARLRGHQRPTVLDEGILDIRGGRHPVAESAPGGERFVPNDVLLDPTRRQILIITGPNMAGKSTYIRQVALLTLLAHAGAFLPARAARVDLVDRIFTRIGASDDLSRGQSTFMVEMSEAANILNNATRQSLVILDELGRGTSTFDGLSLAWSIVEHLHHQVGAKTLFATHYHELTELGGGQEADAPHAAARLPRVANCHVAVREQPHGITFLHQILPGGTDKSYGVHVARLAGIPSSVIDRARDILRVLEASELSLPGLASNPTSSDSGHTSSSTKAPPRDATRRRLQWVISAQQLDLFQEPEKPTSLPPGGSIASAPGGSAGSASV